jgi:DnaJ-class molecular chaperone
MNERHLVRRGKTNCPKCDGSKAVMCKGPHGPGMDICPRCVGTGDVWEDSLTESELNPPIKLRYERDDL